MVWLSPRGSSGRGLAGVACYKALFRRQEQLAARDQAEVAAAKRHERLVRQLLSHSGVGSALPEELRDGFSTVLNSCQTPRVFVAEPADLGDHWIDATFRTECLSMTAAVIESLEHLYKRYKLWEEKRILAHKTQFKMAEDQERLEKRSEDLEAVISDAQDVAVRQSSDWTEAMEAVSACRTYAEIRRESPLS